MPSPVVIMKLHRARAGQIKALAEAAGIGGTEAIERLLNLAVEGGLIPDVLPGFEVIREGEFIHLTLEGQPIPGIAPEMALGVADDLEHAGTGMATGKGRPRFYGQDDMADMNRMLVVGRVGSGVVVVFEKLAAGGKVGEGERTTAAMTRGMAVDLARQIRTAARTH